MGKLLQITRSDKFVQYKVQRKGQTAEETATITAHEAPLASFDKALQDLAVTACRALQLPSDYAEGMQVLSVTFSYTQKGTASCVISFEKTLDKHEVPHRMATPSFRFEKPAQGEDGRMQCTPGEAEKIETLVKEADKYIDGKRQQMILPLEQPGKKAEPADGPELPLGKK